MTNDRAIVRFSKIRYADARFGNHTNLGRPSWSRVHPPAGEPEEDNDQAPDLPCQR